MGYLCVTKISRDSRKPEALPEAMPGTYHWCFIGTFVTFIRVQSICMVGDFSGDADAASSAWTAIPGESRSVNSNSARPAVVVSGGRIGFLPQRGKLKWGL